MTLRLALALSLAALAGCGKAEPKVAAVSGTVTLDGKLLPEGTVYFKTVATGGIESFPVKDGKFAGRAEVGERRVEINAYKSIVLKDNSMGGEIQENIVADRYNTNSVLTATVTAQRPNEFMFEVKGK
jgi:hypothetical protein